MGKAVPIKFNDEELAKLMKAFGASDDPHVGTHIKRVYFAALRPNLEVMEGLRTQLEALNGAMTRLESNVASGGGGARDETLLLTLICGIYSMIHASVPQAQRIQVDKAIDKKQVDHFLKG